MKNKKHTVTVRDGSAELELVRELNRSGKYHITLVDMNSYNFFPPLLYQLAAGLMELPSISCPFRCLLCRCKNIRSRMVSLQEVTPAENKFILSNGELSYDILVMAMGTESGFFGNKEVEEKAMPIKIVGDALMPRNLVYTRLECAIRARDREQRHKLLPLTITRAGPTGVELSRIFAEVKQNIIRKGYPELTFDDLGDTYLIDGQETVSSPMLKKAQEYTEKSLLKKGVRLKLSVFISNFANDKVHLSNGTASEARDLIWAAGVSAKTFKGIDNRAYLGRGKRIRIDTYSKIEGFDNIYTTGDASVMVTDSDYPEGRPQLAQIAIQQTTNLGKNFNNGFRSPQPFSYVDKGSMTIMGCSQVVVGLSRHVFIEGFFAWATWALIHIISLVNFRNKMRALYNWVGCHISKDWSYRMVLRFNEKAEG